MKILIAADDSPHSERAIEFVTRMRWPAGSRMIVANVLPPGESDHGEWRNDVAERYRHQESFIMRVRDQLRDAGLSTEGRAVLGDAREQLLKIAAHERVDLIVMGSRGQSRASWLGSVSSHAVAQARCSVLVVKGDRSHEHEGNEGEP